MESLFTNDSVSVLSNAESLPTAISYVWSVASLSLFKILKKKSSQATVPCPSFFQYPL